MILGLGNDIVQTSRIAELYEKSGQAFLDRIFTAQEQRDAKARGVHLVAALARRFAAKEAAAKALGTGFRGGIGWKDIEIVSNEMGKPVLNFYGEALAHLQSLLPTGTNPTLHVSLSDEKDHAFAVVMIEAL